MQVSVKVVARINISILRGKAGRIVYEILGGGYYGCECPNSGPFACMGPFFGPSAKTALSRKAVLFNGQILVEAE